jgi:hypothetical protein
MKTTDGEIWAIDQSGRISFNLLRHHRSHAQALLFYTFDVIVCQGKSLVSTPLEKRQALLNYLFVDLGKNASPLCLEMKNCVWVKPERSCKSSSVNGRRMGTCDIQSLWGYVRTKSLAKSCLNDDDSYPKARMSCLFTLRTGLRYGQPS